MGRIYLDNAATSWPKPDTVCAAVEEMLRISGAPAGRGGYEQGIDAARLVEQTRGLVAELINAPHRNNIVFTFNGTDSLSTAILGFLNPGDHVVTTVAEHNSTLRPLTHLESTQGISMTCVGCDPQGRFHPNAVLEAVTPDTRLICVTHVSNVTGAVQPIDTIKSRLLQMGHEQVALLVDAAQSVGHLPIDVQSLGCDMLAAPGHKGLLGPLGTGVLYLTTPIAARVTPLRFGGTGSDRSGEFQPIESPEKFESGNLNIPGIAGLHAGIQFLNSESGKTAHANCSKLAERFLQGLLNITGVQLQGPPEMKGRVNVFSFSIDGFDCHEASAILDTHWSIQTRSGLHCAPLLHRALGTESSHGTIRISLGLFNTETDIQTTLEAIAELAQQAESMN